MGFLLIFIYWFKNSNEIYLGLNFKVKVLFLVNLICINFVFSEIGNVFVCFLFFRFCVRDVAEVFGEF